MREILPLRQFINEEMSETRLRQRCYTVASGGDTLQQVLGLGRISDTVLKSVNQRADATCKQEHESPIETTLPCSYTFMNTTNYEAYEFIPTTTDRVGALRCTAIECIISVKMYVKSSKSKITLCLP